MALTGWYISSFGAGDYLKVSSVLYKNGNPIGFVSSDIFGSSANYKQFSLPITYSVAGNADSANINMILLYAGSPDFSSFALVDDLVLSSTSIGVEEMRGDKSTDLILYSDRASGRTRIEYQCSIGGPVRLLVRDLNGRPSKILVNGYQPAGKYGIEEDFDDLQEGFYLVEMETAQGVRSGKLCVVR